MRKINFKGFGKISVAFLGTIILATGFTACEAENELVSDHDTNTMLMAKSSSGTESEIIEIINNNCGTIDYDQAGTPEAKYHFTSLEEFEQTISGICNSSVLPINLQKTASSTPCGDGMYTASISIGPTYSLNFWVTITDGRVSAVSSGLSGFHFGVSWSQGGWAQSGSNVYVSGTFTAGLGFGVWSHAANYRLILPC